MMDIFFIVLTALGLIVLIVSSIMDTLPVARFSQPGVESEAALRGIALHAAMKETVENEAVPRVGKTYYTYEGTYGLTQEDLDEALIPALEALQSLNLKKGWAELELYQDRKIVGRADLLARDKYGVFYLIDYKFGRTQVSPEYNEQLARYLRACYETFAVKKQIKTAVKIVFAVIQPTSINTLETWEVDMDWFEENYQ